MSSALYLSLHCLSRTSCIASTIHQIVGLDLSWNQDLSPNQNYLHLCRCVSLKCYNDLFPEPIEDGEVISHLNTRLKRCLREEVKLQKALEAQQEIERRRGESL